MRTELGAIATLIQAAAPEPTPLQRRLDHLGRTLAMAALSIVAVIFGLGLLRGEEPHLMFLTAVSIAVAAVPEGLPAVVTIALALGGQRMLKRHALIRKLPAVETLGSIDVICADKTGTLTENRMTVTILDVAGHRVDLLDTAGGEPAQAVLRDGPGRAQAVLDPAVAMLLAGSTLCNDATSGSPTAGHIGGDPTEVALLVAAERLGLRKADLDGWFPRVGEVPFDAGRKRMTTIHAVPAFPPEIPSPLAVLWDGLLGHDTPYLACTKGAVDSLLAVSRAVWVEGRAEVLDAQWQTRIAAAHDQLAQDGMRVLGVAFRTLPAGHGTDATIERDLIFVGLLGIIDPARNEARAAVQTCRTAGIRPVMITGDHPLTAAHIARRLGLAGNERIVTGAELQCCAPGELDAVVETTPVYARVAPEQ